MTVAVRTRPDRRVAEAARRARLDRGVSAAVRTQLAPRQGISGEGVRCQVIPQTIRRRGFARQSIPGQNVLRRGIPSHGIPRENTRRQGISGRTMRQDIPGQNVLRRSIRRQGIPGQNVLRRGIRRQGISGQNVLRRGIPDISSQNIPRHDIPHQGIPRHSLGDGPAPAYRVYGLVKGVTRGLWTTGFVNGPLARDACRCCHRTSPRHECRGAIQAGRARPPVTGKGVGDP